MRWEAKVNGDPIRRIEGTLRSVPGGSGGSCATYGEGEPWGTSLGAVPRGPAGTVIRCDAPGRSGLELTVDDDDDEPTLLATRTLADLARARVPRDRVGGPGPVARA